MSKKVKNIKKSKEIVKSLTKQEIKNKLKSMVSYENHPDSIYKKSGDIIARIRSGEEDEYGLDYLKKNMLKLNDFGSNHINLANTVPSKISTSVVELANNLIEEYNCETSLEKTLCEIVANSYGKIMSISKTLDDSLKFDYFGNDRNGFISIMSKELDRANRNYLTAINNLIEIKRPQMNINVKTNNAYFGQNQQINNNKTKDENIKD